MSGEHEGAARPDPVVKLLIELGPLVAFFAAYYLHGGIIWATGVLMVATVLALGASWFVLRRLLLAPVITAAFVIVFGGLTLWLDDPTFIKRKPTIINLLFAGFLAFGLLTGRPLLKVLLGEAFSLTEEGWHKLTIRWTIFFALLAVLNEIVWRNLSEAAWVNFKFGMLPLTMVFAIAQIGLIKRYEIRETGGSK
jgi:intracellular septation protein